MSTYKQYNHTNICKDWGQHKKDRSKWNWHNASHWHEHISKKCHYNISKHGDIFKVIGKVARVFYDWPNLGRMTSWMCISFLWYISVPMNVVSFKYRLIRSDWVWGVTAICVFVSEPLSHFFFLYPSCPTSIPPPPPPPPVSHLWGCLSRGRPLSLAVSLKPM